MKINLGTIGVIAGTAIAVAVWFNEWRTTESFRFDALETRIENLESRMDTRMDNLDIHMGNLETRMENLETEMRELRALTIERLPAK